MFNPENLIRKGLPKGHFKDIVARSLLGGTTYLVVAIAALLFVALAVRNPALAMWIVATVLGRRNRHSDGGFSGGGGRSGGGGASG